MKQVYHANQEYQFHRAFCEFPEVADEHLCGGKTSHFIAALLIIAALVALMAAGTAYLMGGAEEVVYRRHAEIRAGV